MKYGIILLGMLFAFTGLKAQNFTAKEKTLQGVFTNLVNAYGSAKTQPKLELLHYSKNDKIIAKYYSKPPQTIKVDEKLFDICMQMGADSLNALSIVLSHELAHYYNDHNWCSDFAFAIRNTPMGKQIETDTKENNVSHEREADNFGLYHSCIAGYHPFNIDTILLNKIYSEYKLPDTDPKYPTLKQRKQISIEAQRNIEKLYPEFVTGIAAIKQGNYDTAIYCFNSLNTYFPSRENYNNLGTAKTLKALQLKERQHKEFIYPIEIDTQSRLKANYNRSSPTDEMAQQKVDLLKSAKKDFEKAITLDPKYITAQINLACVHDILGNPDAALGVLKDLNTGNDKIIQLKVIMLKAIAYYHSDNDKKVKEMVEKWRTTDSTFYRNNYLLFQE